MVGDFADLLVGVIDSPMDVIQSLVDLLEAVSHSLFDALELLVGVILSLAEAFYR